MKVAQHQVPVTDANKMESQQKKRIRPASLAFEFPCATPLSATSKLISKPSSPIPSAMSYQRNLSPGGRRLTNPGSASASAALNDPYRYERHNSYTSPRASNGQIPGVIPISSQTFHNVPPPGQRSGGQDGRFDAYSGRPAVDSYSGRPTTDVYSGRPIDSAYTGRPRRSSLVDQNRGQPNSSSSQLPQQRRPTVIQQDYRPASPQKREKDFYITPGTSKEPRKTEHKKLYTVNDGSASLVADVDVPAGGERHHKRRESFNGAERGGYRTSEKDRGRRGYHLNGPSVSNRRDRPVVDDEDFKYTDPAGMFNETEPAYRRPEARPRRGSVDRGGANSRERPISMIEPNQDPRSSNKQLGAGPPPSYRGWDRVNEMGRANSVRERGRDVLPSPHRARVPQSPTRARVPQSPTRGRYPEAVQYGDANYYIPPRRNSMDRQNLSVPNERGRGYAEYDDRKESRHRGRRESVTRANDRSVERRGFGIRADSQDRYGRGSDESFEGRKYRDSGYAAVAEPHRRETAPEANYRDDKREQERRDHMMAQQMQNEERDRAERDREPKRRDEDRGYDRGYDRQYERERDRPRERDNRDYDLDREREMERERMMAPQPPQPVDRHHNRQDSTYRDFPRESARKDTGPRDSSETHAQPGLSTAATAATAGLAGAAATFGIGKMMNRDKDDREKDRDSARDRERDRDSDRGYDKPREADRDRRSPRFDANPQQERRSDEGVHYSHDRNQASDQDRGLGFAFEGAPPQPPRSAPPMHDRPQPQPVHDRPQPPPVHDRPQPASAREEPAGGRERDIERDHGDKPVEFQQNGIDAEEDYRRRMEQAQRELGRGLDDRASDSDPDRERRRREREQRRNERHGGQPPNGGVDSGIGTPREMPGSFNSFPEPNGKLPQRDFDSRISFDDRSAAGKPPPRDGYEERAPKQLPREYDDRLYDARGFDNRSFESRNFENDSIDGSATTRLTRKPSILDQPMGSRDAAQMAHIIDNSQSERRENRVKIVDPPTEEEDKKPKGILKKPTEKFPENPDVMREGVAPLKDATKKGIPPGARWTRIDRRLVNPESLEAAKERFEERQDCVIVLRVLTKEEIQKFADKTNLIREEREAERRKLEAREGKESRHSHRNRDRRERDEYEEENSEDEFKPRAPKMLEAPSTSGGASTVGGASSGGETVADFRERRDRDRSERDREREGSYVSGASSRRTRDEEKRREYDEGGKRREDEY